MSPEDKDATELLLSQLRELHAVSTTNNDAVRQFWSNLENQEKAKLQKRVAFEKKLCREERQQRRKEGDSTLHARETKPKLVVRPKSDNVCLGWSDESFAFDEVVLFSSHIRRSDIEKRNDEALGINRCVFSNLFVDDQPLAIDTSSEPDDAAALLGSTAAAYREALCAESFYMAAKCRFRCDAIFVMEDLQSSYDVCCFGHNRLHLTEGQKSRLIDLGADPDDFLQVAGGNGGNGDNHKCNKNDRRWLRGRDGKLPVRENWLNIRHNVFLYILRHKFAMNQKGTATRRTTESIVKMTRKENNKPQRRLLLVEHRERDGFWGDAGNGTGYNVLGKTISHIFLQVAGDARNSASTSAANENLTLPVNEIANYAWE